MKKNLIIGVLVLCSMVLVVGSVFAIQTYSVKCSDVFLEDEGYNQNNSENKQEKSGDFMQGLLLMPAILAETIGENQVIVSN